MAPGTGRSRGAEAAIRVAVAVTYGAVMLAAVLWGGRAGMGLLVSVIATLAVLEFYEITRREHRMPNEVFGMTAVAAMPLAAGWLGMSGLTATVTALVVVSLLWHLFFRSVAASDTAVTVFGAVYVGFTLSHLVLIRELEAGTLLLLTAILSVWANDSFAYIVGATLGRHRMAPRVSPHKSWEGFAAGTIFTIAVWLAAYWVAERYFGGSGIALEWHAAIGVAVSAAAVVGDLAESRLKREAGVKDSGRLLPGHGGFLDRHDSLILVSVVAYYLLLAAGAR